MIILKPLLARLQRIMRYIHSPVEEKRPVFIPPFYKTADMGEGLSGEKPAWHVYLPAIFPEVVDIGPSPVIEMRIAVNTPSEESPEVVESTGIGCVSGPGSEMPLPDTCCLVSAGVHPVGNGLFPEWKAFLSGVRRKSCVQCELPCPEAAKPTMQIPAVAINFLVSMSICMIF